ncbi:MAG: helix-turn-helix domain-containing protein [Ruminococcus sp.]|nr:helix-turn-helix domain-containing protein [Ruminococcus sp.]
MKYKRILIECSKNYAAKIFRNPFENSDFQKFSSFRWHKEYEMIYVEKGTLQIKKLDKTITVNSGEFYLLNVEEVHAYSYISPDIDCLLLNLRKNALNPYVDNKDNLVPFVIENKIASTNILQSLKVLYKLPEFDHSVEVIKVKAILNNILYYLIKYCIVPELNYVRGSSSNDFDYAKKAIDYMYCHYRKNISLNEIAKHVGLSPSHFSKYFRDKTTVTFSKYLSQIRLEKALLDMSVNGVSVKEAAENNGFPNVNSFIVSCKKICNRTPLETLNLMQS